MIFHGDAHADKFQFNAVQTPPERQLPFLLRKNRETLFKLFFNDYARFQRAAFEEC